MKGAASYKIIFFPGNKEKWKKKKNNWIDLDLSKQQKKKRMIFFFYCNC